MFQLILAQERISGSAEFMASLPVPRSASTMGWMVLNTTVTAPGIVAAILAEKFDHMAAITNFIITPLSFLSGTFYSIEALPPLMQTLTHLNPVFYLIDGVRYGMIGTSDSSPWLGLAVVLAAMGIRAALGAEPGRVLRSVLTGALRLAFPGLLGGAILSCARPSR